MIHVESYLKTPGALISSLPPPEGSLIPAAQFVGPLEDENFVDGALVISVDGTDLITLSEWDDIVDLWCYIINMLTELKRTGRAVAGFPDQPIGLSFEHVGESRVRIAVMFSETERRVAEADRTEFDTAIRRAGAQFFREMLRLVPGDKEYAAFLAEFTAGRDEV